MEESTETDLGPAQALRANLFAGISDGLNCATVIPGEEWMAGD